MNDSGPKCNYPVPVAKFFRRRGHTKNCNRPARWRVKFWGNSFEGGSIKVPADTVVYRCVKHRECDVGLRVLAYLTQEETL